MTIYAVEFDDTTGEFVVTVDGEVEAVDSDGTLAYHELSHIILEDCEYE
jgi:hypothetical protein